MAKLFIEDLQLRGRRVLMRVENRRFHLEEEGKVRRPDGGPQLTPELIEPLSAARLVVFVDARRAETGDPVRVQPIEPGTIASMFGRACNPQGLLASAQAVFGSRPPAWLVTVPATNLAVGEGLSPTARDGLVAALQTIADMLGGEQLPRSC